MSSPHFQPISSEKLSLRLWRRKESLTKAWQKKSLILVRSTSSEWRGRGAHDPVSDPPADKSGFKIAKQELWQWYQNQRVNGWKNKRYVFFNIFTELMLRLYQLQISVGPMLMLAIGFLLKITLHKKIVLVKSNILEEMISLDFKYYPECDDI